MAGKKKKLPPWLEKKQKGPGGSAKKPEVAEKPPTKKKGMKRGPAC